MRKTATGQHLIEIQLMANLSKYRPAGGTLLISSVDTVIDVIRRLGIEPDIVQMAFVDGKFIHLTSPLKQAARLLLLPAIGGG